MDNSFLFERPGSWESNGKMGVITGFGITYVHIQITMEAWESANIKVILRKRL